MLYNLADACAKIVAHFLLCYAHNCNVDVHAKNSPTQFRTVWCPRPCVQYTCTVDRALTSASVHSLYSIVFDRLRQGSDQSGAVN